MEKFHQIETKNQKRQKMKQLFTTVFIMLISIIYTPKIYAQGGAPLGNIGVPSVIDSTSLVTINGMVNPNYDLTIAFAIWAKEFSDEWFRNEDSSILSAGYYWADIFCNVTLIPSDYKTAIIAYNSYGVTETVEQSFTVNPKPDPDPTPVPTTGIKYHPIMISSTFFKEGGTIDIYDLMGRLVDSKPSGDPLLSRGDYPAGFYIQVVSFNKVRTASRKVFMQ